MIELRNVSKTYNSDGGLVKALQDVTLTIEKGEFVAIIGPSGSGKSTLMHILGLLDRPDSGRIIMLGRDVSALSEDEAASVRNRVLGFVFQQFYLIPRMTALQNVMLPMVYSGTKAGKAESEKALSVVGLASRMEHRPNQLSGGEQQRVAIARALVNDPFLIFADEPTGNLDSRNQKEIISMLKDLNRAGKTVVLVTHDREIASNAARVIEMKDGVIVKDTVTGNASADASSAAAVSQQRLMGQVQRRLQLGAYLAQSFYSITTHKMRSFLSIIGVLIGVAAVISMMAITTGASESIKKSLASLGSNLLMVRPGHQSLRGVALESGTITRLTMEDARSLAQLPSVYRVSPAVMGRGQLVYNNKNWNTMLYGTGEQYQHVRASVPVIGRFFTPGENDSRSLVVVIGTTVAKQLFGEENPVGKMIKVNRLNFVVIGVMPVKGSSGHRDWDDMIVIPISTAMFRVLGHRYVDMIDVEVKSQDLIEPSIGDIKQMIARRHDIKKDIDERIEVRDMTEIKNMLSGTAKVMSWLLGSIAAISILVGGIGIMNIMLVSVTERTKEIGIRKAIGATNRDITVQFLIESMVLTACGGFAGILVGAGVSWAISTYAKWPVSLTTIQISLAILSSGLIGIVFGILPARKAASLNPINALRYE